MSDGDLNVGDPVVLSGLLFGAMLPYMFAALTMISVGKAAAEIILEVESRPPPPSHLEESRNQTGVSRVLTAPI